LEGGPIRADKWGITRAPRKRNCWGESRETTRIPRGKPTRNVKKKKVKNAVKKKRKEKGSSNGQIARMRGENGIQGEEKELKKNHKGF